MTLLSCIWFAGSRACAAAENLPPVVSIEWPRSGEPLSADVFLKLKAVATDSDGSVVKVQFFIGTNVVATVTNAPFNALWYGVDGLDFGNPWILKAVATDNFGAASESDSAVLPYCVLCPPMPIVEIISPREGEIFAAPASFVFSAEVLASRGDAGPVEFFAGTNSLGVAGEHVPLEPGTPPVSISVSNLMEGEHELKVAYLGSDGFYCTCSLTSRTIRVVKLAVQSPRVNASGQFEFEVLTSFPGRPTIIQASSDLMEWTSIHTNEPSGNAFWFTESPRATNSHRFYRARVPDTKVAGFWWWGG
jgi:hypothetical protein